MTNCNLTTNTPLNQGEDPCNGRYKSTQCVREPNALTEIGTPANSTQQEVNQAIQNAIFNLKPNTNQVGMSKVKRTLTPAEFLLLNTNAIEVIPAPGVGKSIKLGPIIAKLDFNTAAYSDSQVDFISSSSLTILQSTTNTQFQTPQNFIKEVGTFDRITLTENEGVSLITPSVPSAGDSNITFYITYEIITL